MIGLLLVIGGVIWFLVALAVAVVIGMSISTADRKAGHGKPCCPHPPSEAPDTVRGEFRAVVVPMRRAQPVARLDVRP